MGAEVDFLTEIAQRATVIVIVAAVVLVIAGIPASRRRYRTLAIVLTVLSGLAACEWYVRFAVHSYIAQRTMWIDLAGLVIFIAATVIGLFESLTLAWFKHRMNSDPNHRTSTDGLPRPT